MSEKEFVNDILLSLFGMRRVEGDMEKTCEEIDDKDKHKREKKKD